jgi:hypothetical protein
MCDALTQEVLIENRVPLAMGRATRTFTPDQFRALVVRDAHCRGPGCRADPAHCEAHHLDEWIRDDSPTDLGNGLLVCRGRCHRMLHEGGWTVRGDPNHQLAFYDRDGRYLGTTKPHEPATPILTKRGTTRARMHRRIYRRAHALRRTPCSPLTVPRR